MKKKISIILPIYNVSQYLEACLKTIVGQHEDVVEILLIDDGSTDSSGSIADQYAERYSNVAVYHKENGGLSDARNYGLLRATGEYVFFLDSDDFIKEESLDVLLNAIEQNEELDIVLWDADLYDENGIRIEPGTEYYHHVGVEPNRIGTGQTVIEEQLAKRNDYVTTVWLGLYKRSFLIDHGFLFERGLLHEDELWTQKVFIEAKRVVYLEKVLYAYRVRSNSIMRQTVKDYSKNIASLIYCFSTLPAYLDWKVKDDGFRRQLKGNIAKRYLHVIAKYDVYQYPKLAKKIDRLRIFRCAATRKDRLRAFILCLNMHLYCKSARFFQRTAQINLERAVQ